MSMLDSADEIAKQLRRHYDQEKEKTKKQNSPANEEQAKERHEEDKKQGMI